MEDKTNNIGDTIKKLRELKNITREQMAADLGLSLSGYSKIERNEVDLTLSRIKHIAQIIGVDIAQLLNFDASTIFNISNNNLVQASVKADNMHIHTEEKYIAMLEKEIERLKKLVKD